MAVEPITAALERFLGQAGPRPRVLVAFSGGLDSTVLAQALVLRRRALGELRLIHVDHGLQAASRDWARHCARMAHAWNVELVNTRARIGLARGDSVEAVAREARQALFARELRDAEILVTAQHRDDQVETLLLQLFRGAGVSGLAAMPAWAPFAAGRIARPLLELPRAAVEAYARDRGLHWVEDPTNAQTRFGRNYLRHQVLPAIRERWPGADAAMARSARHMAEAAALLDEGARRDLYAAADGSGLNAAVLRRLPLARRRRALRAFIAAAGIEAPPARQLEEIVGALLLARVDAQPEVRWPGATVRRRAGRLELQSMPEKPAGSPGDSAFKSWCWEQDRLLLLSRGDALELIDDPAGPIDLAKLPGTLHWRARRGGESLRPGPRARTQALKKLMQAARLTVEQRARLPLLFAEGDARSRAKPRLIAAGDRWIDASVAANVKSRRRARLVWKGKKGTDLFFGDEK